METILAIKLKDAVITLADTNAGRSIVKVSLFPNWNVFFVSGIECGGYLTCAWIHCDLKGGLWKNALVYVNFGVFVDERWWRQNHVHRPTKVITCLWWEWGPRAILWVHSKEYKLICFEEWLHPWCSCNCQLHTWGTCQSYPWRCATHSPLSHNWSATKCSL